MRIGLIGDNSLQFVDKLLDIWNIGACAVVLDWRIPFLSTQEMLLEAGVEKCFVSNDYYKKIDKDSIKLKIETYKSEREICLLSYEIRNKFVESYSQEEALILYSSGTTGKSKGVILSHFAINANADATIKYMSIDKKDRFYILKSLAHSSTIVCELLVCLKTKIDVVIAPTISSVTMNLKKMREYNASIVCMNPTLLSLYVLAQKTKNVEIKSLKTIYTSGSKIGENEIIKAKNVFANTNILNVYGLTEAGPRVAAQTAESRTNKNGSVGKVIENVEIKIMNKNGKCSRPFQNGIIHVKTKSKYKGYVSQVSVRKSFDDNWINTGDIGYLDADGELFIMGRVDNMILVGAHNVFPEEVEKYIMTNDNVKDCIVLSQKNKGYEERMLCFYVADSDISYELLKHCKQRLSTYEIPIGFIRVDSIFVNENGKKIRKTEMYSV